jgi:hypothetical protein
MSSIALLKLIVACERETGVSPVDNDDLGGTRGGGFAPVQGVENASPG